MKRSRKLYVLLGIFLLICVGAFGICKYEETKERIKNSDEIILNLETEDVNVLSWEYESESLAFHRDESWIYDEDEAFPVNEEKVNELLELFQEFGVSFIIEEVEDYGQYGLDDPICTIHIETENETYDVSLGDYSTMDSERYVSIGDGNVYLVSEDPYEKFEITLADMIDHDEMPDFDEVEEIQFAGSENYQVVYEEDSKNTYCADDVYFVEKSGDKLPLDTSRVSSYLNTISNLNPTDYVTYNATEEEIETYGLDDPELTVTVQYTVEDEETEEEMKETFVLNISRDPEEREASESQAAEGENDEESREDNEEEEITAYVRVGESQIIYQITSAQYKNLMAAAYDDLRHEEVLSADFADIYRIDISLDGADYTITSEESDDARTYYYGEEELEIADFESALTALEADSFTDEEATQKEEISMTVYLDNENYPKVSIALYRYDGNYCLAVVDGEPVSLVERNDVVDLIEAVNAIVLNH